MKQTMSRRRFIMPIAAIAFAAAATVSIVAGTRTAPPSIEGHGAVHSFPAAKAQPREASQIVVDLTAPGPREKINPGVEKLARYVNIYSQAGRAPATVKITAVLHGEATAVALNDEAYSKAFNTPGNPNLKLIGKLRKAGVEFVVCGQAMQSHGYKTDETAEGIDLAVSALTAIVNRQQDGHAYIPLAK